MDSYDIRFWDIKMTGNGTAARYRVRWAAGGREHCKSFKARPLADGFLTELKDAVRGRRPFDARTGLPEAEVTEDEAVMDRMGPKPCTHARIADDGGRKRASNGVCAGQRGVTRAERAACKTVGSA
jgi:hypothetical protein